MVAVMPPLNLWTPAPSHETRYNCPDEVIRLRIDPEDLRRHYASVSDPELLAIDPADLTDVAQKIYDEEVAHRQLTAPPEEERFDAAGAGAPVEPPIDGEEDSGTFDIDNEPAPDWLEDAACACAFQMFPGRDFASDAAKARTALRAAGIPCHITEQPVDADSAASPMECSVMVPGALSLHAASVLDRAIFNPRHEAEMRNHFQALSDDDLRHLDPAICCAGLLDRAARLKKAYADEIARRRQAAARIS